jgi:competence protein ComEA
MAESSTSAKTPSKILEFSRKELIAALFLISTLLIGMGTKYTIDHHWWLPETKVADTNPESIRLKINLNMAEWYEFIILPGIGEKKAKAIVKHRKSKGAFRTIEQLCEVNGIGAKTVKGIKDSVFHQRKGTNLWKSKKYWKTYG